MKNPAGYSPKELGQFIYSKEKQINFNPPQNSSV